jgi:hypothetical protein
MQRVIAGYDSREQAELAVRSLEPHLSIQDVVIADKNHRAWRKLHPDGAFATPFLVVMNGKPDVITRARELLRRSPATFQPHADLRGGIPTQTPVQGRDVMPGEAGLTPHPSEGND